MEQTLLVVLIEILIAVLIALLVLVFLNWRKTMRCHTAMERLFSDVRERQTLRTERIVACLTSQYKLDRMLAQELAATLFSAETLFLTQFIEQQMRQQSVEGFYQNLCELLDSYLQAIPQKVANIRSSSGSIPLSASAKLVDEQAREREKAAGDMRLPE